MKPEEQLYNDAFWEEARRRAEVRIEELEQCLFEGLTVSTDQELHAWFKRAEALLGN